MCFLFVSFRLKTDAANHAILRIKAKDISSFHSLQHSLNISEGSISIQELEIDILEVLGAKVIG